MKRNADQILKEELEAESYDLFGHFNSLYFDGALEFCVLKWSSSKSMHQFTGICNYVSRGECEIYLYKSLLQSRSINDLKNSLLHHMIHAFLWVKYEDKNHSDHSLNFQNMRDAINSSSVDDHQRPYSGYNVPLDHKLGSLSNCMFSKTYNHVQWMCNTCGLRTKKTRAPSDKDCVSKVAFAMPCNNPKCMWHNHKNKCAGTFTVAELQAYKAKKVNPDEVVASNGTQDRNAKKMNSEKTVVSEAALVQDRTGEHNQGKIVLLLPSANTTKICKGPCTRRTKRREIYKKDLQQRSKNVVLEDIDKEEEDESIPPLTNKRTERRKKMKLMQIAMKEAYEKMRKEEENDDGTDEGNECDTCGLRTEKWGAPSDKDRVSKVGPAVSCNNQKCMWFNYQSKRAETFTVAELQAKKPNSDEVAASNDTEDHNAKEMNPGKTVISNAASVQDGTVKHDQKWGISKRDLQGRSENAVHEDEEEDGSIPPLVNKRTEQRNRMKLMQIAMKEAYEKMRKEEENEDGSDEG